MLTGEGRPGQMPGDRPGNLRQIVLFGKLERHRKLFKQTLIIEPAGTGYQLIRSLAEQFCRSLLLDFLAQADRAGSN